VSQIGNENGQGHRLSFGNLHLILEPTFRTNQGKVGQGEKMANDKKCGNPACSCIPPEKEDFCSAHCEAMKGKVEVVCTCGHAGCAGDAIKA
jgi:hypothetical protein